MDRVDAPDHAGDPRFFNQEPDGFAVLGGLDVSVEYADPALRELLPDLTGDLSRSSTETGTRIFRVAVQVLETGVAALVKGLPTSRPRTVGDLMLKRTGEQDARRVLAMVRVRTEEASEGEPAEPSSVREAGVAETAPAGTPVEELERPAAGEATSGPEPPTEPLPGARFERVPGAAGEARVGEGEATGGLEPITSATAVDTATEPRGSVPAPRPGGPFEGPIARIGLTLLSAQDTERGLERALTEAAVSLGSSAAVIVLRRNRTSVIEFTYGLPEEYKGVRSRDGRALVLSAGTVLAIEDVATDDRVVVDQVKQANTRALLATPLVANDEAIGLVSFTWRLPQSFTPGQRAFVRALSSQLSPYAQVLRLTRVAERQGAYVAALLDAVRMVTEGGSHSRIAASVLEVLHSRLGLAYGDIRVGEDDHSLHRLATLHRHDTVPSGGAPDDLGQRAVFEHRTVMGRSQEAPGAKDVEGVRHISVPFDVEAGLVGVMDLTFLGSRRFTPDETGLFGAVANLLALALSCPEPPAGVESLGNHPV